MKNTGLALLAFVSVATQAAPFLESDDYPAASNPKPTHCVVYMDAASEVEIPVFTDATGTHCRYDLASVAIGPHSVRLAHRIKDVFGVTTSAQSATLNFTRPAPPLVPSGLIISPN